MENYTGSSNLPSKWDVPWGNINMNGDDYHIDMFGIKWSDNEQNLLFPDEEDSKQPDVVQVNSLGCVQGEDDNTEEDVRPYNDTMYVTNCSSFSSMSVYSSSALNNCLELSPIDSTDCFDPLLCWREFPLSRRSGEAATFQDEDLRRKIS